MPKRKPVHRTHKSTGSIPFECVALMLQGGGALGAYQGGVYQALSEAKLHPNWVAGISIGAINCAIIAGNPPEKRVERLREFWEQLTSNALWDPVSQYTQQVANGDISHTFLNQVSAATTVAMGLPGFFRPRLINPWIQQEGSLLATSYYDSSPLKSTLERLVDFDRLNSDGTILSVGTVNVRTGNFVYFDTRTDVIKPEHIMASGALPPGLPAIEIDGEYYWDGGLITNTPLEWVLYDKAPKDTLAFQVDLWSARGELPQNMAEVSTRQKEIVYSSRTRAATDKFKESQKKRHIFSKFYSKLPENLKNSHEAKQLSSIADPKFYNIIHLIYHSRRYEGDSKDYEFSQLSMSEHWTAGYNDTVRTLRHPEVLERPINDSGVFTFDVANDGRG